MNIIKVLKNRYSTKEFDETKKMTEEQIVALEDLLQLSPSATNIQPWQFIIATTEEGKKKIAKSASGFYSFNEKKILNSSAVVVFASKVTLTEEHLNKVLDKEELDGRYADATFKAQYNGTRTTFANMHKFDFRDFAHWSDKQLYINLGNFLLGVACLGLDAVALEGLDFKILNEELNFSKNDCSASFAVAVGYHKDSDFNKNLPKSRLDKADIIKRI